MFSELARYPLAHLPTPIAELPRLSETLGGPRLLVKRDDMTGLATGGNKTRKLEFLIAEALAQKADTVISTGAAQSNHCRQTAAAAARAGLRCILVLGQMAPERITGNLLIDQLVGAQIRWSGDRDQVAMMEEVAEEERSVGRVPYVIPYGGSNPVGAAGYVLAMDELTRQILRDELRIDHIVFATSSGGTQAGMTVGALAHHFEGSLLGISVAPEAKTLKANVLALAQATAQHLDLRLEIDPGRIVVNDAYTGEGYGIMGEPEREAITLAARSEGLLVDPVYTGRALAGLIDLIRKGQYGSDETVLFWHTGGSPALFAHAEALANK